jgi:hypothetical protein
VQTSQSPPTQETKNSLKEQGNSKDNWLLCLAAAKPFEMEKPGED